jgi:hypothetical protein
MRVNPPGKLRKKKEKRLRTLEVLVSKRSGSDILRENMWEMLRGKETRKTPSRLPLLIEK